MQQPEPPWKAGGDRLRRHRYARVAYEEFLGGRWLPQRLGKGHANHEQHEDQREGPEDVDLVLAESNFRHDAGLWRQPVREPHTIVGSAQACGVRVVGFELHR